MVDSNVANDSLPTLQILIGMIALFEGFIVESQFLTSSQISGRMYNTVV